ncbi:MAG: hypothetical protein ABI137_14815 [Antricoccus sp.]
MAVILSKQGPADVSGAVGAPREWQHDAVPMQLHPGDLGWFWRFGIAAIVAAVRTWSRDDRMLAVALLDGPDLARVTTAPNAYKDEEFGSANRC